VRAKKKLLMLSGGVAQKNDSGERTLRGRGAPSTRAKRIKEKRHRQHPMSAEEGRCIGCESQKKKRKSRDQASWTNKITAKLGCRHQEAIRERVTRSGIAAGRRGHLTSFSPRENQSELLRKEKKMKILRLGNKPPFKKKHIAATGSLPLRRRTGCWYGADTEEGETLSSPPNLQIK